MRKFDTTGADPHKVRPVVRAAMKAHREMLVKVDERDRAGLDQPAVRRLGRRGLKLVMG